MHQVAVIGTGYIGVVHLEQLLRLPNIKVIGITDANPALAADVARRFGVPRVYPDAGAVLADPAVTVIHTCTPNHLHFAINKQALLAGKHVLSEKPLALTAAESGDLVRLARRQGLVTGINFCYRYYPVVQEAAARVARGDLGAIYHVMGSFLQDWLLYPTDYSWRLDPAQAGASNIMGDLGSHWCDLAQFVTGQAIREVMAELRTLLPVRRRPRHGGTLTFAAAADVPLDDVSVSLDEYGALLLRFAGGASGTFTTCQLAAGRKCAIDLQVYGAKGGLAWSHDRPAELWLGHRQEPNQVLIESPLLQAESTRRYARLPSGHPMGYMDAVLNLFGDFYQAIAERRAGRSADRTPPDFEAGHAEMRVLEAALASRASGAWAAVQPA